MPTKPKRPKLVLDATLTADGKLDGAISGVEAADCRRLLASGQIDELRLTIRPRIDGRRGTATLSGQSHEFFSASVPYRLLRMETQGDQCLLHYRIVRRK